MEFITNVIGLDVQSLIYSFPMPTTIVDAADEFRFVMINRHANGAAGEPLLGKRLKDMTDSEKNLAYIKVFFDVAETKKERMWRSTRWEMNGRVSYYDLYFFPVMGKEEKVKYVINMGVNVTEATLYAEELGHERDLRDAFLSHLGHELNQPLYIVKATLEALGKNA